jgi:hypothetical protein
MIRSVAGYPGLGEDAEALVMVAGVHDIEGDDDAKPAAATASKQSKPTAAAKSAGRLTASIAAGVTSDAVPTVSLGDEPATKKVKLTTYKGFFSTNNNGTGTNMSASSAEHPRSTLPDDRQFPCYKEDGFFGSFVCQSGW